MTATDGNPRNGRVFTFYSYKGGTGRTMALANVAWILASQGKRVLTIDWDLEAPGLHRFFAPFLADPNLSESDGLIDFLSAYVVSATKSAPEGSGTDSNWYESYADIKRYAEPLQWLFRNGGLIDLVGAGRQNMSYGTRVNGFDWEGFYTRFGGGAFLDATIRLMKQAYDFILVDSRTGISDTSGISTIHVPDALVVFYTLNNQSIEGASGVATHVAGARQRRSRDSIQASFPIFPIATRVELAEKAKLEARRALARVRFLPFVQTIPERADRELEDYWGEMEVLYDPYYAYEETLATIADRPRLKNSILAAFERLSDRLTDGEVSRLGEISESKRKEALQLYARMAPDAPSVVIAEERHTEPWDVVISASSADKDAAERLFYLLASTHKVFYARHTILPGSDWRVALAGAVEHARAMLVLFSTKTVAAESEWARDELEAARDRQVRDPTFTVIPVQLEPNATPPVDFLRQIQSLVVQGGDLQDAAMRIRRIIGGDVERGEQTAGERLKAELDQAVRDKTRLREQLAQLEDEARNSSEARGTLSERAAGLERQTAALQKLTARMRRTALVSTALVLVFVSFSVIAYQQRIASTKALQAARLAASAYEVRTSDQQLSVVLARNAVQTDENTLTIEALRRALETILGQREVASLPVTAMIQKAQEIAPRDLTAEERTRYLAR